jgi:hypothetical protein
VKDDPDAASASAEKFLNTVKQIDVKTLSGAEQKAFASVKEKLVYNSDHISEVQDLNHQREHFAALSLAMSNLAQSVSLSDKPIYVDYCPMKKSYWLSEEKDIKNPYYGKQMLDCGNVEKTIMPGDHSMQTNDEMNANSSTKVAPSPPRIYFGSAGGEIINMERHHSQKPNAS